MLRPIAPTAAPTARRTTGFFLLWGRTTWSLLLLYTVGSYSTLPPLLLYTAGAATPPSVLADSVLADPPRQHPHAPDPPDAPDPAEEKKDPRSPVERFEALLDWIAPPPGGSDNVRSPTSSPTSPLRASVGLTLHSNEHGHGLVAKRHIRENEVVWIQPIDRLITILNVHKATGSVERILQEGGMDSAGGAWSAKNARALHAVFEEHGRMAAMVCWVAGERRRERDFGEVSVAAPYINMMPGSGEYAGHPKNWAGELLLDGSRRFPALNRTLLELLPFGYRSTFSDVLARHRERAKIWLATANAALGKKSFFIKGGALYGVTEEDLIWAQDSVRVRCVSWGPENMSRSVAEYAWRKKLFDGRVDGVEEDNNGRRKRGGPSPRMSLLMPLGDLMLHSGKTVVPAVVGKSY